MSQGASPGRLLVVDDERSMREFLEIFFRDEGYEVVTAGEVSQALLHLENDDFDLVISDIQLPQGSGLDILRRVQEGCPETVVVMITAYASTETAISAIREGAYDYITKPFAVDEIRIVVEKALEKKQLSSENRRLKRELSRRGRDRSILGSSAPMQRILDLVQQVAQTRTNVLITGESGTGKEMVARAIHQNGDRKDKAFVAVNCAAIPENLLESELFGHVRGAFTGAVQNKEGLFESADKGTLFLDEVAELSPPLQVKLLRVIQEKTIRRVGGNNDRSVDVRILTATNRNLQEEVAAGRFREDLYYRLNVIEVSLPPLRERSDDIPRLAAHFIEKYATELGRTVRGISEAAMARIMAYEFPGNVRELENVIERAVALCAGESIDVDALPPSLLEPRARSEARRIPPEGVDLEALTGDYERGLLLEALEQAGGVKKRAAALLGITFRSFRYRLEKLGIEDPQRGEE